MPRGAIVEERYKSYDQNNQPAVVEVGRVEYELDVYGRPIVRAPPQWI